MNLLNNKVKHITFGMGTVIAQGDKHISVEFAARTCNLLVIFGNGLGQYGNEIAKRG